MSKKKVFLSPSDQSGNSYAYGNTVEQVQCEYIAQSCKTALERSGVEVMVAENDTANWKAAHVTASNNWKPDIHIPIHTNAVNGKTGGCQVYYGSIGADKARVMYDELRAVFPDSLPHSAERIDGSKTKVWVEFNSVSAYTLYLECNFHDVPSIAEFIVKNTEVIGEAIARATCKILGVPFVEPPKKVEASDKLYRVQVGAFHVKSYAEAYCKKAQEAGFEAFVVEV